MRLRLREPLLYRWLRLKRALDRRPRPPEELGTPAIRRILAISCTALGDTLLSTPGLRALEKHAVACGGGINHRFGLDDAILIKDNHVAVCGGVAQAVRRARAFAPHLMKVEVEVDGLDQLDQVLVLIDEGAAPDVVMLDNFSLADLRTAVARVAGRLVLEASGGVDLTTVRAIAETGVDYISIGAMTKDVKAVDLSMRLSL